MSCVKDQPPKETTPKCGCHATGPITAYQTGVMLVFCPLHAAAAALLNTVVDLEKRLTAIEASARYATGIADHETDLRVGTSAAVRWGIVGQAVDAINEARGAITIAKESR